ncbi:unnamed protein product [Eruca vesicaria subsp. sativa]|uniref:F-box domain-containing protein n=1 Tax=Eruca vesicaria subsp. sativa TaxID=29727 RepID=A0ABC8JSM4_ERUVS|nr:unnamed protein product [Eruca vesicaria subsp. sativa]
MSNTAEEAPSWSFWSLPNDIILDVLARVPRRYQPILSCVSKKLQSLVRSSELQVTRSLRGKEDRFYVCLGNYESCHWFTFTESHHRLASISIPYPRERYSTTTIMVGTDIYFVGGWRNLWILDTRSGELRQGPKSPVLRDRAAVGLVNDKIYIFGGFCRKKYYEDIQAQAFDLNTQTWQFAPNPSVRVDSLCKPVVTPALGRKIYVGGHDVIVYDTRDGTCDKIIRADVQNFSTQNICVVDNVLYAHVHNVGLMWYESKAKEWSVVHGLKFKGFFSSIKIAEYNGKLAYLWHNLKNREIWCSVIALYGSRNVAIRGRIEWSDRLLSDVPSNYVIKHFMVCTDDYK